MDASTLQPSQILTDLAVRIEPRAYLATKIFHSPEVPEFFEYPVWDKSVIFKPQNDTYGQDGSVNMIDTKVTKVTARLKPRALGAKIDPTEARQAGAGDLSRGLALLRGEKTWACVNGLYVQAEKRVAAQLRATAVMTLNETLAGAAQWSDATSDPKKYLLGKGATIARAPNTLVVGRPVFDVLLTHPKILEAAKFVSGIDVQPVLARYFGVDRILVGEAQEDTAAEGQAQSLAYIWGKDAILAYIDPSPPSSTMRSPTLGYLPRLQGIVPRDVQGQAPLPFTVYEWTEPGVGTGGGTQMIKAETWYDVLVAAADYGFLVKNAVA